jgi:hypothetical protein
MPWPPTLAWRPRLLPANHQNQVTAAYLTEADIITYLAHNRVTEQRASKQMRALRRHAGDRPDIARAVRVISNDEDNHLAYCHEELLRLAAAGHGEVIRATLHATALAEIAIYRDVSLAVMAHLGRILGWPRPKSAVLAAGIRGVYAYELLGGGGAWCRCACRPGAMRWAARYRHSPATRSGRALGLLATRATRRPDATEPGPSGAVPAAVPSALGPGAAGRRGADRPGRRQPGRRRPAAAGPPLTTRTVRVLTGGQDPHPGPPDALAP